jgi:hypothetical protein
MFSRKWWGKTFERMVKTAAGALITFIGTDVLKFKDLQWDFILYTSAVLTLLSFLGAILTTNMGPDSQDPSAV